jgi:hypothetical protein
MTEEKVAKLNGTNQRPVLKIYYDHHLKTGIRDVCTISVL